AAFTAFAADPPAADKPAEKGRRPPIETFTDADQAGPDFQIQGEYVGDAPGGKAGIQIIAEGDGQFAGRALRGGVPGDGWDGTFQIKFEAKRQDGKVRCEFALPRGEAVKREI